MNFFRIAFIKKIILLTIFFHIVNSSIDAPDILPEWTYENLSYNEIESVTEWLLEVVLSNGDCIQEYDDNDDNKMKIQLKKKKNIYCCNSLFAAHFFSINTSKKISYHKVSPISFSGNVHSPPPEFII